MSRISLAFILTFASAFAFTDENHPIDIYSKVIISIFFDPSASLVLNSFSPTVTINHWSLTNIT